MKLSELQQQVAQDEEGAVVPLADPDGNPYTASDGSEVTVTVVGKQSKAYRRAQDQIQKAGARRGRTDPDQVPGLIRENAIKLAAAGVVAWHGIEDETGAEIPFSEANVRMLLAADDRILDQVAAAIERHHAFFSSASKS